MISPNWQIVILDAVIIVASISLGLWFAGNLQRKPFVIVAIAFVGMGLSFLLLSLGDLLVALGIKGDGDWYMERSWRALPWRYGFAFGLTVIAGVLRFGRFKKES